MVQVGWPAGEMKEFDHREVKIEGDDQMQDVPVNYKFYFLSINESIETEEVWSTRSFVPSNHSSIPIEWKSDNDYR